ncbi:unnamed protein product [Paramecium sonneborni]|uniref:Uncharacterized protein n=1 Tax=Paramecium sonneborni TaxID=65129 RepID=A0A8S1M7I7_9CILI|nr:unnamed protein product [Paramecium sonneborni]
MKQLFWNKLNQNNILEKDNGIIQICQRFGMVKCKLMNLYGQFKRLPYLLLIGFDITNMSQHTRRILINLKVIVVNQDNLSISQQSQESLYKQIKSCQSNYVLRVFESMFYQASFTESLEQNFINQESMEFRV